MLNALVTGASRDAGKGIAIALHDAGYRVFATGRTIESADLPSGITRLPCDHTNDADTDAAFARIAQDTSSLDVVVNNSWGGYERMVDAGQFAIYGVSKAATDKLTADMAHELRTHGVSVVSLYPGLVRTEAVLAAASQGWFTLDNSESPEFLGRVIAALAADPTLRERSGRVVVAARAAIELGVTDVDGKQPAPLTLETV